MTVVGFSGLVEPAAGYPSAIQRNLFSSPQAVHRHVLTGRPSLRPDSITCIVEVRQKLQVMVRWSPTRGPSDGVRRLLTLRAPAAGTEGARPAPVLRVIARVPRQFGKREHPQNSAPSRERSRMTIRCEQCGHRGVERSVICGPSASGPE